MRQGEGERLPTARQRADRSAQRCRAPRGAPETFRNADNCSTRRPSNKPATEDERRMSGNCNVRRACKR
eukprot:13862286-Alexandrium_andersonii.AAC.1